MGQNLRPPSCLKIGLIVPEYSQVRQAGVPDAQGCYKAGSSAIARARFAPGLWPSLCARDRFASTEYRRDRSETCLPCEVQSLPQFQVRGCRRL